MEKQQTNKELCIAGVLAVIIFLVNIRNIAILNGPYMFNDELGYLGNAAALAGKDWHEVMQYCAWYGFGWSIVIAPLFNIFSDMQIMYRFINVFNALLVVAVYIMQRHILQKIFRGISPCLITAVSACVCFYPSILVNSSIAWCETWLLFVFTAITVFLFYMIQNPRMYKTAVFAGLLYYFYVCHNRMIAVLIAGIFVFIILIFIGVIKKRDGVLFLGTLLVSSILFGLVKDYLVVANWRWGLPSGNDIGSGLTGIKNLLTVAGFKNFVGILLSRFLYICIASYGMMPLGLYAAANKIIQAIRQRKIQEIILEIWLILSFLGIHGVSTIAGIAPDIFGARLDHIFYGRYFEPTIIMLMSYGFLYLANRKRDDLHFEMYKVGYLIVIGVCAFVASTVVSGLSNPVFNKPNASGIAAYVEQFSDPLYFMYAAALFSIIGTEIIAELFCHKNVFRYIAMCGFVAVGLWNMCSAEKSITRSQESYIPEIPLVNTILTCDTEGLPIYVLCDGNYKSYFQCMLPNIPLKYARNLSLTSIPDETYYVIASMGNYVSQGYDVFEQVLASSGNNLFLYVDKTVESDNKIDLPLEALHLKECSKLDSDHIHIEATGETLAFYGPYIPLNAGSYILNIKLNIENGEELENYGAIQIYSHTQNEVFGVLELTQELIDSGVGHISFPFVLGADINDIEIYLRPMSGISYDIYSFELEKSFIFNYELNTENTFFSIDGFSHAESAGRWMDENEASISCYLPSDNYDMTVDLGYSVPLDQLALDEYSSSIYINNVYFGDIIITDNNTKDLYQFEIPEKYVQDGTNTISIKCEELWSPADYGSKDSRRLGLCIERIIFTTKE